MDYRELTEEYEIDIKALFITILQRWRLILIFTLAGAVALGGLKYVKEKKTTVAVDDSLISESSFETADAITLDQNTLGLSPTDNTIAGRYRTAIANYETYVQKAVEDPALIPAVMANKNAIERMQKTIENNTYYFNNSLVYKANTFEGVNTATQFILRGYGKNTKEDLEKAALIYGAYLENNDIYKEIADEWETEPRFIKEVVYWSAPTLYDSDNSDSSSMVVQQAASTGEEKESYGLTLIFKVDSVGETREKAEELQEYIVEALKEYQHENPDLSDYILQVEQVSYTNYFQRWREEDWKNNLLYYSQMQTLNTAYEAFRKANEDVIAQIEEIGETLDTLNEEETEDKTNETTDIPAIEVPGVSKRGIIKYAVFGAALGMIGGMGILFLYYLLRKVVLSADEVNDAFRLRPLGELCGEQSSKHHTKFDHWLVNCKEDASYRNLNEANRYDIIAKKIQSYSGEAAKHLLVVGTCKNDPLVEIAHKLSTRMGRFELKTTSLLNGTKESLDNLEESDGIILVLNIGETKQDDILKDIETAQYYGKDIIGTVAVL